MKWCITGGCGFIGSNLVAKLVANGQTVRVLDDLSVGDRAVLQRISPVKECAAGDTSTMIDRADVVELAVGDICNESDIARSVLGADIVVHLAANTGVAPSVEDPRRDCEANVLGTLNALEAARASGVRRFVFASSGAPLGEVEPPIHERLAPRPVSPYGASKLAGEAYCSAYYRSFGLETVALRFGNVYGPGSPHKSSVVAKFITRAARGLPLQVFGDGSQTRDFVYVLDLLEAILRAAKVDGIGGELFQIATSRETSVHELVQALAPVLRDAGFGDLAIEHGEPRVGDVARNYADTSKARDILGWSAKMELASGLRETVRWFVAQRDDCD